MYFFNSDKNKVENVYKIENMQKQIDMHKELCKNLPEKEKKQWVKTIANSIQCSLALNCFRNNKFCCDSGIDYIRLVEQSISVELLGRPSVTPYNLQIHETPIITCVWNIDRLQDSMLTIGAFCWKPYDAEINRYNVRAFLVKPLGLVIVYQGNHSVNAAIIHNEGEISISEEVDITPVLEKYDFDGVKFVDKTSKKKVNIGGLIDGCKPIMEEMGMLFELAKILGPKR